MKIRNFTRLPAQRFFFCNVLHICMSRPCLLIESIDPMIQDIINCLITHMLLHVHVTQKNDCLKSVGIMQMYM